MTLERVEALAAPHGLFVMGVTPLPDDAKTWVILGAAPALWPKFQNAPESRDSLSNPLDRYSKRVIGDIARDIGATEAYPSDGPPYPPFIANALASGSFFKSPVGMMVHPVAGMMISIRGALILDTVLATPPPTHSSPCGTCVGQPCTATCPVGALTRTEPYKVTDCKTYLHTIEGKTCMTQGCAARLACPVSRSFQRDRAQNAFHMRAFKGA